jgi:NAD(P)-dependent dehydrogenase (short-subunit alcohol dehydrogenase family)
VADFDAVDGLARKLQGTAIDVLLNNAGVFGPRLLQDGDNGQAFGHVDYSTWQTVMRVNTFAPVKVAEAFVEHVARSGEKKIVAITSTMGSITETYGGYYVYRASKAALNMAMVSLAKDLAPRGISVAVYCPGWVKTDMGGSGAEITADVSIRGLRRLIGELSPATSGTFHRYNGDIVPW